MSEAILVFVLNFMQTFARTQQIYFLNKHSKWLASLNSGFIATLWLASSFLGLKGIAEQNLIVVFAYILSGAVATYITIRREERKDA